MASGDPSIEHLGVGSFLAHGGGAIDRVTGAVVPGIPMATTFARDDAYALTSEAHLYVRDHDDAVRRVEDVVRHLEGAAATRVFASGMATITAIVRSVRPGESIVLQSGIYWAATATLRRLCAHHAITLVEVDATDTLAAVAVISAQRPALVFVEALSNPMLGVVDIAALADATHEAGGVLAVDATVPTPLSLRALALGADLAVHSASKALNGHSDVLAGVVSTADADSAIWGWIVAERAQAGAVLGPLGAWLLLRGMRTLALRHERASETAMLLAEAAAAHRGAVEVRYPGLSSHPGHDLARAQLRGGFGSLLSVRTAGGQAGALRAAGALRVMVRATSLGGVESLVEHRFTVEQGVTDVPEDLLRISVGIEEPGDLLDDLRRALDAAAG